MRLSISLSLFVILLFISSCSAIFTKPTNIPQCLYPKGKSPSSPTCFDDPNPSQVKRTTLVLSYQTPPGFPKPIIAINNTYPGPTLEYNQFDMIEVTVVNQLGVDTSLHFHGARQYKTPYSDGVTGLTQCPIGAGLNMTYRLCLDRSGTFWYHGHHGEQTADGFVGAMIVHPQPYGEVYASQYDHDLPLLMADFYNVPSQSLMPFFMSPQSFGHEPVPDQFVVNGKFSGQLAYGFPRTSRVRLRLISAAAFSMFTISLDGYNMTIIEVDGTDVEPYAVTKFALNVAQRVSILIDLSSLPSNVPGLQLHSVADPGMFDPDLISANAAFDTITNIFICDKTTTTGVCANPLQPSTELIPMSKPDWTSTTINSQNYNQPLYYLNVEVGQDLYPASDYNLIAVRPLYPAYATGSNTAACYTVFSSDINKPDAYVPMVMDFANDVYSINRGRWNGITWDNTQYYNNLYQQPQAAPQPRLYDMVKANNPSFQTFLSDPTLISTPVDAVTENTAVGLQGMYPDSFLNNSNNMFNIISPNAIGQYILPHNKTIELMVINQDSGLHPIHFHGYAVYIISSSEMLDAETDNAGNYPLRDVWTLPGDGGWVKLRIITDNPGVWAFHCHITWHFDAGLVAVFIDNLDALQNDPFYSNGSLIPADHQAVCQNYAPNATAPLTNLCVNLVENEFGGTLTPASQTRWAMLADLIIMSECAVGLILYKLNILNYILAELIGMNIGTLVGVVFVELIKETYEKVMITGTMTYVNVTIVMCFGFLFPLFLEKFIKRGRSNKFSKLSSAQNQSQSNNDPNSSTIGTQPLPSPISNFATKNAMSSANLLSNNNNDKIKDESKEVADERFTHNGVEMSHIPKQASCVVFHTDNDGAVVVDTTAAASIDTTARFPSSSVGEVDEAAQVANQVTKSLDDIQLKIDTTEQQVQTSKKKRGSGMERIASMLSSSEGETDYTLIIIILAGEMVDNFVDGGIIASAFLTSDSAGIATAIGVFMEELPHLTGSFAVFVAAGAPIWKCILINITAASAYIVGTGFIMGIASNSSINPNDVFYLLPWAIGTFLYVALVDLTPVITNMPWRGYWRALTACLSVCFGIGIQASVAVYSWKKGTS